MFIERTRRKLRAEEQEFDNSQKISGLSISRQGWKQMKRKKYSFQSPSPLPSFVLSSQCSDFTTACRSDIINCKDSKMIDPLLELLFVSSKVLFVSLKHTQN
jgi:hypothetical protein